MYFLDSHVHVATLNDFPDLLDSCVQNMRAVQEKRGSGDTQVTGLILLAEIHGQDITGQILRQANEGQTCRGGHSWDLDQTLESGSIRCRNAQGDCLYCVTGTQINAREKVEVLLFGHNEVIPQRPLQEYLELASCGSPQLLILPWGVGKWLGRRGKLINEVLQQDPIPHFFLGDNGNRPQWWTSVSQFTTAKQQNIPVLRGTDPLFVPGQLKRVGTYGHIIEQLLDSEHPLRSLCSHLQMWPATIHSYGKLQGTLSFLRSQLALRGAKYTS